MSDFQKYLEEQLKDPEFRKLWEARNKMILQRTAGAMALSGMDLTEKDKERILYLCNHPDEEEAMLQELIRKHTVPSEDLIEQTFNGKFQEGDLVRYDDGVLCFTVRLVRQDGLLGFVLDDVFQELATFIQDFSLFPDRNDRGAERDFEIIEHEED